MRIKRNQTFSGLAVYSYIIASRQMHFVQNFSRFHTCRLQWFFCS